MNELTVIREQEVLGKDFKIYGDYENPLFLAKDVAEWLEMDVSNASKLTKNLDSEEYVTTRYNNTSATFLTEDGLYEVLMQSRKPIAKAFKKEVKQILKSVRKHGMYAKDELLDNPDLFIATLEELKVEREQRKQLEGQIEEDKPFTKLGRGISASQNSVSVNDFAKSVRNAGLDIGQNRLFQWFRDEGFLCTGKANYNRPYQRYIEEGLFELQPRTYGKGYYNTYTRFVTRITAKGQEYFFGKLSNDPQFK